ncbi:MAG: ATP-binding cassette domain-containing protein [Betaproteobacteria bacterium]|nr:ATP-binding cassette domain-containing protein [Betaproteobacteria bacterium]
MAPPNAEKPLIVSFTQRFEAGRVYAITGASGVGKSTLAKQLLGIWPAASCDVQRDPVQWAGVPMAQIDELGWRAQIGYLPQDVVLMEGRIAENIGRMHDEDHEGIAAAAMAAGVHEMILRMPKGYDTQVGEGGGYLSAGQRQRIGLARALYGNPKLLVLDEPNASLDPAGEAALGAALLHAKSQGAIVILITHRAGVLQYCDEILELKRAS